MLMIGILFIIAGAITFLAIIAQVSSYNSMKKNGKETTGKVLRKIKRRLKNKTAYLFEIEYSVDGVSYTKEFGCLPNEYEGIIEGAVTEIIYNEKNPKKAEQKNS